MIDSINQFRSAIAATGLNPPDNITAGKLHRFPGMGKSRNNRAAYCRLFDDCLGGFFGDWSADYYDTWKLSSDKPLSKAWPYQDETERMAEQRHPPSAAAVLHAGTRKQLIERYGLHEEDFADN